MARLTCICSAGLDSYHYIDKPKVLSYSLEEKKSLYQFSWQLEINSLILAVIALSKRMFIFQC